MSGGLWQLLVIAIAPAAGLAFAARCGANGLPPGMFSIVVLGETDA